MLPTLALLAAPVLLPRAHPAAEVAHDLGLDAHLRGTLKVAVDATVLEDTGWRLEVFTAVRTFVRSNRDAEGPVRISPEQIWFPVGARLRFPWGDGAEWGLFARHQSNHDVDSSDARQNVETIAYEVYGGELAWPHLRLAAGIYYDRGTTRALRRQTWPFDYYLGGLEAEGERPVWSPLYVGGGLELIALRDAPHTPSWLDVIGRADVGVLFPGEVSSWRFFLRFQRVEDYRFLGDTPHHLLLLGTGFGP